jgi:hypothetical protein
MLFGLYVGSTAFVWIKTIKDQIEMDKRLKEEGYVFTVKKFDKSDIPFLALSALAMSLPIFNLVLPLSSMDKDRCYDEYKNRLLEAGSIELKEDIEEKPIEKKETINKEPKETNHVNYQPLYRDENVDEKGYTYKKEIKK